MRRLEGPTRRDLQQLKAEWPVLAAELEVTSAECALASHPSELTIRALRRAEARLEEAWADHVARLVTSGRPVSFPGEVA